ncbi:hypothetical protein NQ318_016876 [Aromia moschata]|uniref:BTB domain-containing protein n=1 Tax=Aromia moschata TaxID=1265417 RepID=A0AAV8X373_9CUCU|nr:hypothetical protein NQ318_016876 [Aromia moschata]
MEFCGTKSSEMWMSVVPQLSDSIANANITSQFETLRDDEDFTDVTIACEGQRLQAHKVVLSACSPFFKELFKTNPCSHPIIFMRGVEARHIVALLEFMYAGGGECCSSPPLGISQDC